MVASIASTAARPWSLALDDANLFQARSTSWPVLPARSTRKGRWRHSRCCPRSHSSRRCNIAACGEAPPPAQTITCTQCGATAAVTCLAKAVERVNVLGPALRANALEPAPEIVKRRLTELEANLPQRREWAESMVADARGEMGDGRRSKRMARAVQWQDRSLARRTDRARDLDCLVILAALTRLARHVGGDKTCDDRWLAGDQVRADGNVGSQTEDHGRQAEIERPVTAATMSSQPSPIAVLQGVRLHSQGLAASERGHNGRSRPSTVINARQRPYWEVGMPKDRVLRSRSTPLFALGGLQCKQASPV
jgi:hypothetical protein